MVLWLQNSVQRDASENILFSMVIFILFFVRENM